MMAKLKLSSLITHIIYCFCYPELIWTVSILDRFHPAKNNTSKFTFKQTHFLKYAYSTKLKFSMHAKMPAIECLA